MVSVGIKSTKLSFCSFDWLICVQIRWANYDLPLKFTIKYAISAAPIPNIFASKANGKLMSEIISASVVLPPTIIEESAANELGFFVNNPANTGIIIPDTIKE